MIQLIYLYSISNYLSSSIEFINLILKVEKNQNLDDYEVQSGSV